MIGIGLAPLRLPSGRAAEFEVVDARAGFGVVLEEGIETKDSIIKRSGIFVAERQHGAP